MGVGVCVCVRGVGLWKCHVRVHTCALVWRDYGAIPLLHTDFLYDSACAPVVANYTHAAIAQLRARGSQNAKVDPVYKWLFGLVA